MRVTETTQFSQGWLFHSGHTPWWQPTGEKFDAELTRWREVCLPHCFNAEDTFTPARGFYTGICWYRKTFTLPQDAVGKRVFIEFGAAYSLADVWVNEHYVGQFMGGYTGFSVDATDLVKPGDNLIGVKVDNSHDVDILPGIEGKEMDYLLYGGLYREASLLIKDDLHIARNGITVTTPAVSDSQAELKVKVAVRNDARTDTTYECVATLRSPSGAVAATVSANAKIAARSSVTLELDTAVISAPDLWSVDTPNLYSLEVVLKKDGAAVDADTTTVGFRWFEFTVDHGFFLNGRRVQLRGLNRHQDYPGLGNALPPRMQVREAERLKEMGVNFVRLSHYPQHPAFLDACDRLGIVLYAEIASWQYIGGEMFARNVEYMMREMIARDKNHPSIILWGLLNEGRSKTLFERLHRLVKECDPTRPTVYADNEPEEGKKIGSSYVPDVIGLNYKLPHVDEIRALLPDRKFVSSETTNYEHRLRGDFNHDVANVLRYKNDTDIVEAREFLAGMALWSMHDYGTDYELSWPIQNSGALDCYRLPKAGYWFLRCRWSTELQARVVGHWNWPDKNGETIRMAVCHNGESVELFLNGQSLGVKTDAFLALWDIPYAPGTLRAVTRRGDAVAEHTLTTSGEPASLRIEVSDPVLNADGADAAEITLTVLDKDGHPALTENGHATFRVEGPANLRGIAGLPCTPILAGTGRIIVQAKSQPGEVTVRAAYRGLAEVSVSLTTN